MIGTKNLKPRCVLEQPKPKRIGFGTYAMCGFLLTCATYFGWHAWMARDLLFRGFP